MPDEQLLTKDREGESPTPSMVGELPAPPLVTLPDIISWLIIGLSVWLIFTAYSVGSAYLKRLSAANRVFSEARARLERPAEESAAEPVQRESFLKRLLTEISGARESLQEQAESIRNGKNARGREIQTVQDPEIPDEGGPLSEGGEYKTIPEDGIDRF